MNFSLNFQENEIVFSSDWKMLYCIERARDFVWNWVAVAPSVQSSESHTTTLERSVTSVSECMKRAREEINLLNWTITCNLVYFWKHFQLMLLVFVVPSTRFIPPSISHRFWFFDSFTTISVIYSGSTLRWVICGYVWWLQLNFTHQISSHSQHGALISGKIFNSIWKLHAAGLDLALTFHRR